MTDFTEIEPLLASRGNLRASLITLVRVEGSSYRKPGAKMLVTEDGRAAGAISGGCLEQTMRSHGLESIGGKPHVVMLDTSSDTDLIFGHGLGCPGKLHFLVEPFVSDAVPQSLQAQIRTRETRETWFVVSSLPDEANELRVATWAAGSPRASEDVDEELQQVASGASATGSVEAGATSFFVEIVEPPVRLLLFGSGLDVAPFVRVAESTGLDVTKILKTARGEDSAALVVPPEECTSLRIDPRTAVVVMTHNYLTDLDYLRHLLRFDPLYIGVIGSGSRFQKLVQDLSAEGFEEASLRRLSGPAGLDIGAETPAQIALSVVAEIHAAASGRRELVRIGERGVTARVK